MEYQLVVQFSEALEGGLDELIKIEDEFCERLGADADVDGHDIGSGQMNIFIITSNPLKTFSEVQDIITSRENVLSNMKAAYRRLDSDHFIYLYPEDLAEFNVI